MLDAESGISDTNFDRTRATTPARFDTQYRFFRYITSVSVFGFCKTTTGIPFSPERTDYIAETQRKAIKKTFGRLVDFIF